MASSLGGLVSQAGGAVGGGLVDFGFGQASSAVDYGRARQMARDQRQFLARQYTIMVRDLERAGLSKLLAFGAKPMAPGIGQVPASRPQAAMASAKMAAEMSVLKYQERKAREEALIANAARHSANLDLDLRTQEQQRLLAESKYRTVYRRSSEGATGYLMRMRGEDYSAPISSAAGAVAAGAKLVNPFTRAAPRLRYYPGRQVGHRGGAVGYE